MLLASGNPSASTFILFILSFWGASAAAGAYNNGCTTTSLQSATQTVTLNTISTYCPVCDQAKLDGSVYTTIYATTYLAVCSTGLTSSAYTVTNVATGTTTINPSTCPPGFTTTAVTCTACIPQTIVPITTPLPGNTGATAASNTNSNKGGIFANSQTSNSGAAATGTSGSSNSGTSNSGTSNSGTSNSGTSNSSASNSGTSNSGTSNSNSGTSNSGSSNANSGQQAANSASTAASASSAQYTGAGSSTFPLPTLLLATPIWMLLFIL